MQRIIYIVLMWCLTTAAYSQQPAPSKIGFKLNGFRQTNKVILRWMLDDAVQWRYANEQGYIIERAEGGSKNYTPLASMPLKPLSRAGLAAYDSASAVFQAASFVLNPPATDSMRGETDEQMYSFYFLAASYTTQAAVASASGFVDETATPGKTYSYRITVAGTKITQQAGVWEAPATAQTLPAAPALKAAFSNRKAVLTWDNKAVIEHFFATVVERSFNDSLHFAPFPMPVVKVGTGSEKPEDEFKINYDDSLTNGIITYYRIKGLNLFGVTGSNSNTVRGAAGPDLNVAPNIESVDANGNNRLLLKWSLPDSVQPVVARYEIWRSNLYDTAYQMLAEVKAGVPFQQQLSVTPLPVNYFVVKAIGTREGQVTASAPFMYQLIDSIAPIAPSGLTGKIDSNGVVTLTWKPNTESDLLGYRVLRGSNKDDEFVALTASPDSAISYRDTVPVNQLNKSIFYKIVALDQRYNESQLSAAVEVKRPDKIPPAPARVESVSYKGNRMVVTFIPSFSQDVVAYKMFRKASDDTTNAWRNVATLKNTDTLYSDKDIKEKVKYSYAIQAVDDGNLVSEMSVPLSGTMPKSDELKKGVRNFNTYISKQYKYIELNWQDNDQETNEYWLYRANGTEKMTLIATLPATTKKYVDEDLRNSTTYRYAIKVVYKDGTGSKMEKTEATY